jgi:hypothetical protein
MKEWLLLPSYLLCNGLTTIPNPHPSSGRQELWVSRGTGGQNVENRKNIWGSREIACRLEQDQQTPLEATLLDSPPGNKSNMEFGKAIKSRPGV